MKKVASRNNKTDPISREALIELVEKKQPLGEISGFVMTWQNTGIRGLWLLPINQRMCMSFSLTKKRKLLKGDERGNATDVNWYVKRLLQSLNREYVRIENFTFNEEHRIA